MTNSIQRLLVVVVALCILWVAGCGGFAALPRERISEADKATREAAQSNASINAPVELKTAEDKLAAAKKAFNKKDYDEATRFAEQASVDADFARAKGSSEKARKRAEEIRKNIENLKQDIELLSKKIVLEGGK